MARRDCKIRIKAAELFSGKSLFYDSWPGSPGSRLVVVLGACPARPAAGAEIYFTPDFSMFAGATVSFIHEILGAKKGKSLTLQYNEGEEPSKDRRSSMAIVKVGDVNVQVPGRQSGWHYREGLRQQIRWILIYVVEQCFQEVLESEVTLER